MVIVGRMTAKSRKKPKALPAPERKVRLTALNRDKYDEIIGLVAGRSPLLHACEKAGLEMQRFYEWLWADEEKRPGYEGLAEGYARAIRRRADAHAEQALLLEEKAAATTYLDANGAKRLDPAAVQLARLALDVRRWSMAHSASQKYGRLGAALEDDGTLVLVNDPFSRGANGSAG